MFGNLIKLVFKSFADSSGISKWNESVKSSIGNMGQMSRAAQMLGATMGGVGGAIGRLVGALAQGSIWGVAQQSIAIIVERLDLFGKRAEEARRKNEELAETARRAYADANAQAAKAIGNINKELQARKAMADILDRQYKAEQQLRRAEALRSGDLAKAQNIEAEIANADRQSSVDRADAEAAAAGKAVAEAKRALDAAQKRARDAQKREADAEDALIEAEKPRQVATYYGNGAVRYHTEQRVDKDRRAQLNNARKDVEAADEAIDAARAAYDAEVEKWRVAKENAKAVAKEQEAAAEKEHAERLAAARKEIEDKKAAEKKANEEWVRQRKAAAKKAAEEEWIQYQKNQMKLQEERQRVEREMLQAEQKANTDRANDLREKLKRAQADAAAAFEGWGQRGDIDNGGARRSERQRNIDRERIQKAAIDLQEKRPDWRNARNLSRQDEAARRFLLAKENEQKAGNELKDVVGKLDSIKALLEAATTL